MSLNFLKRQLASVIEWTNQQPTVLLYKYPSANDEIKNASKLIVGPGQGTILVYEGSIASILSKEGVYDVATDNHPFITTLLKLRTAFESEHKLKIYFFRTGNNTNQNWGTAAPIKYVDPVYKFPVELGANGNFSFQVEDPEIFFAYQTGLSDLFTTTQAKSMLLSRITQTMAVQLATTQFSYQQIDAQLEALSGTIREKLTNEFKLLGLLLTDFRINGTIFDKDTQARINSISDVTAESQAAAIGGVNYVEMEKLKALRDAAKNQGGLSGAGLQIGAGLAMSKLFTGSQDPQSPQNPQVPHDPQSPHSPIETPDPIVQLQKLKHLLDDGIITQDEFSAKKKEWLDKL